MWLGQRGQALEERVETLSGPRAKETKEIHARIGAFGTARATTDLACNDQRAHTARRVLPLHRLLTLLEQVFTSLQKI